MKLTNKLNVPGGPLLVDVVRSRPVSGRGHRQSVERLPDHRELRAQKGQRVLRGRSSQAAARLAQAQNQ
jgi:hypothetical protein